MVMQSGCGILLRLVGFGFGGGGLFCFSNRISLCRPSYYETHYVYEAGFELIEIILPLCKLLPAD